MVRTWLISHGDDCLSMMKSTLLGRDWMIMIALCYTLLMNGVDSFWGKLLWGHAIHIFCCAVEMSNA